ncbi:MAG: lipid-A-disaccharide synthase [Desulfosudaceae bacterium]
MSSQEPTKPGALANKCVMIVAGEASGDLHGANLIRSMRAKSDTFFFCGVGGQAMRRAGAKLVVDADKLSVVGITEVLIKLPAIWSGLSVVKKIIRSGLPDLLVLIDFPDFNLRLAAVAKKAGIPVFYYITPQVWAWRKRRVHQIRRLVDHAAVILPFEESFFKQYQVPVTYVGHPLLDAGYERLPAARPDQAIPVNVIGILPGSRSREVKRHLPLMLAAAVRISSARAPVSFLVSCAPSVPQAVFSEIAEPFSGRLRLEFVFESVSTVFEKSTLVMAVSGTVTLEAALSETPLLVVYRVSTVSYWLARALIRLDYISLVNLIAGRQIVPELLQSAASSENIARRIGELLDDPERLRTMRHELREVREKLGRGGASGRAADIAVGFL